MAVRQAYLCDSMLNWVVLPCDGVKRVVKFYVVLMARARTYVGLDC